MSDFKYKKDGEYLIECDSCHSEAPVKTTEYQSRDHDDKTREICEVCYVTWIGSATDYRAQYDNVPLFEALGQVTNILLDAITKRKP